MACGSGSQYNQQQFFISSAQLQFQLFQMQRLALTLTLVRRAGQQARPDPERWAAGAAPMRGATRAPVASARREPRWSWTGGHRWSAPVRPGKWQRHRPDPELYPSGLADCHWPSLVILLS